MVTSSWELHPKILYNRKRFRPHSPSASSKETPCGRILSQLLCLTACTCANGYVYFKGHNYNESTIIVIYIGGSEGSFAWVRQLKARITLPRSLSVKSSNREPCVVTLKSHIFPSRSYRLGIERKFLKIRQDFSARREGWEPYYKRPSGIGQNGGKNRLEERREMKLHRIRWEGKINGEIDPNQSKNNDEYSILGNNVISLLPLGNLISLNFTRSDDVSLLFNGERNIPRGSFISVGFFWLGRWVRRNWVKGSWTKKEFSGCLGSLGGRMYVYIDDGSIPFFITANLVLLPRS